jgi:hypothetical protein
VTAHASGVGAVKIVGTVGASIVGAGNVRFTPNAAGGLVRGGTAGRDSVPIMAMPGEVVVPTSMVRSGAVDHLRGKLPGFANGGIVGFPGSVAAAAQPVAGKALSAISASAESVVAREIAKSIQSALASASAALGGSSGGSAAAKSLAQSLLASHGWGGSQWPPLLALWNRESGWNPNARNPSSGAAGIPQDITGNFHGGYAGQVVWGEDYIAGRYGSPSAAWAHETAYGWYRNGLDAVVSKPTLIGVGEAGRERVQVTPLTGGRGGGTQNVTVVLENHGVIGSQAELDSWAQKTIDRLAKQGKLTYALRHSPSAA